jgi:hypothetical protein
VLVFLFLPCMQLQAACEELLFLLSAFAAVVFNTFGQEYQGGAWRSLAKDETRHSALERQTPLLHSHTRCTQPNDVLATLPAAKLTEHPSFVPRPTGASSACSVDAPVLCVIDRDMHAGRDMHGLRRLASSVYHAPITSCMSLNARLCISGVHIGAPVYSLLGLIPNNDPYNPMIVRVCL